MLKVEALMGKITDPKDGHAAAKVRTRFHSSSRRTPTFEAETLP